MTYNPSAFHLAGTQLYLLHLKNGKEGLSVMLKEKGPEARRGSQGASRAAPGKSGLYARGEGALLSQEFTDLGHRIDCLDLKGVCLEGVGDPWVVAKAGASLEVAEGRQSWARERCGRPRR